jgi:hypothetical protein
MFIDARPLYWLQGNISPANVMIASIDRGPPCLGLFKCAGEGVLSIVVQAPRVAAEFVHSRQFHDTALATLLAKTP